MNKASIVCYPVTCALQKRKSRVGQKVYGDDRGATRRWGKIHRGGDNLSRDPKVDYVVIFGKT